MHTQPTSTSPAPLPRTIDTRLIAAAAALLIFNSHLEAYWPKRWLAADGLLGNTLFLLLSGYGVQMSLLGRPQGFLLYARRRLTRIYPAVFITVAAFELAYEGHWADYGPLDYVRRFIWPTPFTYVSAIMPMYVLLYLVGRLRSARAMLAGIAVGVLVYLASTFTHGTVDANGVWHTHITALQPWGRWAHTWIAVAVGAYLALINASSRGSAQRLALLVGSTLLYFGIRFALIVLRQSDLLTIPVDVLVITISAMALLACGEPASVERIVRWPIVGPLLILLAACTLEVFVVGQYFTHHNAFAPFRFPLNIVLLAALSFAAAWVLHQICEAIRTRLEPGRPIRDLPVTPSTSNPAKEHSH